MKKLTLLLLCASSSLFAQEHFSGINGSKRVGILNATMNPAELSNLSGSMEANIFGMSYNVSNNVLSFSDITNGTNVENKLFNSTSPVNARVDASVLGPSFAFRTGKWAFAVVSQATVKATLLDIDPVFAKAIVNASNSNVATLTTSISSTNNQRLNAVSWGEFSLAASRNFLDSESSKFSAGAAVRFLFPGAYANLGIKDLKGKIDDISLNGNVYLYNASATLNIAYAGALANGFTDSSNFRGFFDGGLNGYALDFGFNYKIKDPVDSKSYKFNAGFAVKGIGSMTFKADNKNNSTEYKLNVPNLTQLGSLDISQFEGVDNLEDIKAKLLASGFVTQTNSSKEFKVNLPTVMNIYADVRLHEKWFVSGFIQQKTSKDEENDAITVQNIYSLTPRFSGRWFEIYSTWSKYEINDEMVGGLGFRIGGFYIGSNSGITAAISDAKQIDFYTGFRFSL